MSLYPPGIVDGSGVLFDPEGINRTELMRLAQKRQMICNFDVSLLGPKGFRVLVDERNVKLPDGSLVEDGLIFRNEFHLLPVSAADIFVPCGGRPEAVDINNVSRLLTAEGLSKFRYIVEGANLFFTQVRTSPFLARMLGFGLSKPVRSYLKMQAPTRAG